MLQIEFVAASPPLKLPFRTKLWTG